MEQSKLPESSVWPTATTMPEGQKFWVNLQYVHVDVNRFIWVESDAYVSKTPGIDHDDRMVPIKRVSGAFVEIPAYVFEKWVFKLRQLDPGRYLPVVIQEEWK